MGDKVIARVGDISEGNSNIWNRAFLAILPRKIAPSERLEIRALSLFGFGLNGAPFLTRDVDARRFVRGVNFLISDLALLEMGVMLAIGFILLGIAFSGGARFYRDMGVAFILIFIGQMDMIFLEELSVPLLAFKKVVDLSLYLALMIWYFSMSSFLKAPENFLRGILKSTLVSLWLVGVFFVWDLRSFNLFSAFFILLFLPVIVDIIAFSLRGFHKSPSVSLANVFAGGTGLVNMLIFLMGFFGKPVIPYFQAINMGMFVMGACVGVEIIRDFASISRNLKKAREESLKDRLTGVYNRTALANFDESDSFSVLLIDVDDLKTVNDRHGQVGDLLLIAIADVIKNRIRKRDILIRYGGDEFVVLLKECDGEDALRIAEDIIRETRNISLPFAPLFRPGVSVGVSSRREGEGLKESLSRADRALYSAKRLAKGRALLVD